MKVINYEEKMGKYVMPEGLYDILRPLSVEEQIEYFAIASSSTFSRTGWGDRHVSNYRKIENEGCVLGVIVDDGVIVGGMIRDAVGFPTPCFTDDKRGVCTYSASDNNGAGYIEVEDYAYFVAAKK